MSHSIEPICYLFIDLFSKNLYKQFIIAIISTESVNLIYYITNHQIIIIIGHGNTILCNSWCAGGRKKLFILLSQVLQPQPFAPIVVLCHVRSWCALYFVKTRSASQNICT
jgi:hypothetical protein